MTVQQKFCLVAAMVFTSACWSKNKKPEESQLDAITAASKRIFGKNVRGYMWALTTDSPALFAQAPSSMGELFSSAPVVFDPFASGPQAAIGAVEKPNTNPNPSNTDNLNHGEGPNPYKNNYFQCWYYAETPVYEKLEGLGLKKLFMNKEKTRLINSNFIDVKNIYNELEQSESLKNLESFALSALPGTCFLFNAIGPLRGKAKGALANAFCSISLASLASSRKPTSDGWGSDKAREHIQKQLKAKVEELSEVNWDVLVQLKKLVASYNSPQKHSGTTQVQCPANEAWVAEIMGPSSTR